jgi:hypothetical protein
MSIPIAALIWIIVEAVVVMTQSTNHLRFLLSSIGQSWQMNGSGIFRLSMVAAGGTIKFTAKFADWFTSSIIPQIADMVDG